MSVRILFDVDHLSDVLLSYDQMAVYKSSSESGTYTEITDPSTRIDLYPEYEQYYFYDISGDRDSWYKASYINSSTGAESEFGTAIQGSDESIKVGWTFDNYRPPSRDWGYVLTPDDMRYTYMFGIDTVAADQNQSEWDDVQFAHFVDQAVADFEAFLTIDIRKRVYKTNPDSSLKRSRRWREGVDYTDIEDPYPFDAAEWGNFGFVQLRHAPVISIERAVLYSPIQGQIVDLQEQGWVRLQKEVGQLNFFPSGGAAYGPFSVYGMPWLAMGSSARYPQGFEVDYTTGYATAEFVPDDLRAVIGMWATIKALDTIGDGLLAGFSSQSVSLDGLSESFSSTQSATSAYFGARIESYRKSIQLWLERNRYKHGAPPIAFVGV